MRAIVVGYDGSEAARRALERVAALARNGADVTVVSAPPVNFSSLGPQPPDEADLPEHARQVEEARGILARSWVDARGVDRPGIPADVILEEAENVGADLIVVGTGRKNVAERLVLGSVSEKVLHHAPCDVLVVR